MEFACKGVAHELKGAIAYLGPNKIPCSTNNNCCKHFLQYGRVFPDIKRYSPEFGKGCSLLL